MTPIDIPGTQVLRRTLLAAALALTALSPAAAALADPPAVDLMVVDRDGDRPLPLWRHHGRLFVAGEPGARYSLRVANHAGGRVLVVLSVDGVNILTGDTAGYGQRGYVLEPYRSYDLTGWRKSRTEVAAFSFAPLPQSYAARTGRPGDVGVIGMAVFSERPLIEPLAASRGLAPPPPGRGRAMVMAPPPPPPLAVPGPRSKAAGGGSLTGSRMARRDFEASAPTEKLGTAHGAREWSLSEEVSFVRATPYPQSVRQIEYDTYANLVAAGVIPPGPHEDHRPQAFPSAPHGGPYVPDPPDDR